MTHFDGFFTRFLNTVLPDEFALQESYAWFYNFLNTEFLKIKISHNLLLENRLLPSSEI
jgi:hypothetical protein